jgi:hypothetical protein
VSVFGRVPNSGSHGTSATTRRGSTKAAGASPPTRDARGIAHNHRARTAQASPHDVAEDALRIHPSKVLRETGEDGRRRFGRNTRRQPGASGPQLRLGRIPPAALRPFRTQSPAALGPTCAPIGASSEGCSVTLGGADSRGLRKLGRYTPPRLSAAAVRFSVPNHCSAAGLPRMR